MSKPGRTLAYQAAEDLAVSRFVVLGTTADKVKYPAATDRKAHGVTRDAITSGHNVAVHETGEVYVEAGAAIAEKAYVTHNTAGKAISAGGTLSVGVVGDNNALTFTAKDPRNAELITVAIIDPAGNNVALSVEVQGTAITVTGATDGASALTSTAAEVLALLNADAEVAPLITTSHTGASTGAGVVVASAVDSLAAVGGNDFNGQAMEAASADGNVIRVRLLLEGG